MTFAGKRGVHGVANIGVPASFARKRGLHVAANVGVPATFARKRGLHVVANVLDPGPGSPIWETTFTFKFTAPGGLEGGADGIAFVIKGANPDWLGAGGGGIGYEGITDALAIEFDTFTNGWDPDGNHIAIHTQGVGTLLSSDTALASLHIDTEFHDGNPHDVKITYDGARLDIYFENMMTPVLTYYIDIVTLLNLRGRPYFGLTAGTGSGYENHDILKWTIVTGDSRDFSYADFSGGAGVLTLYGVAAIVGTALRLTPSSESQAGSAWAPTGHQKFKAMLVSGRVPPPPPPPINDNWANAHRLVGASGTVSGDNTLATAETPDPLHDSPNYFGSHTLWYKWTAPATGNATFATSGGGPGQIYDTAIGVYEGSSLATLTQLGVDDDSGPGFYSLLTVPVAAGHTYYIEVTGYSNFTVGTFDLSWHQP